MKTLKTHNTKDTPLYRPSKYKPPGAYYLEIALKYKTKQRKNSTTTYKFPPFQY